MKFYDNLKKFMREQLYIEIMVSILANLFNKTELEMVFF